MIVYSTCTLYVDLNDVDLNDVDLNIVLYMSISMICCKMNLNTAENGPQFFGKNVGQGLALEGPFADLRPWAEGRHLVLSAGSPVPQPSTARVSKQLPETMNFSNSLCHRRPSLLRTEFSNSPL